MHWLFFSDSIRLNIKLGKPLDLTFGGQSHYYATDLQMHIWDVLVLNSAKNGIQYSGLLQNDKILENKSELIEEKEKTFEDIFASK